MDSFKIWLTYMPNTNIRALIPVFQLDQSKTSGHYASIKAITKKKTKKQNKQKKTRELFINF